jgi:hypothetical protein
MAVKNFSGKTFVAFVDISGFKVMMSEDKSRATEALDKFYQIGYEVLQSYHKVSGIFISDCGVLFVSQITSINEQLNTILEVVKTINQRMLYENFMLTTNIAYGDFSYQDRVEFNGISKNLLFGNAYLDAYSDNISKPKMEPGMCRILSKNIKDTSFLDSNQFLMRKKEHYYFYWNVNIPEQIEAFEKNYRNAKYDGILQSLKKYH